MCSSPLLGHSLLFAVSAILISGCAVIPIPAHEETVVFGNAVAEDEVRSKVSVGESDSAVKALLGEPTINFGPRKVFVYQWSIKKGSVFWALGGRGGGAAGIEPVVMSHLLFIAFDPDGKVLKSGTAKYKPFESMAGQVHDWLTSNALDTQVVATRFGEPMSRGPVLFIYRPVKAPCPFPTYDSNTFKPSVAMDGVVVGDLRKGEYLASEVGAGLHGVTIDPVPFYRFAGQEKSFFVQDIRNDRTPVTLQVQVEPDHPSYVETYLCTGMGKTEMHAITRDALSAQQGMRDLKPAW